MSQHTVTLLLGSNLGNPEFNINLAKNRLATEIGTILVTSEILHNKPVEFVSDSNFCNIAIVILTPLSPVRLLKSIKEIERKMGRKEDSLLTEGYVDRLIDIDIVLYDNIQYQSKRLRIPHEKHLYQRDFSKKLLLDIEKKH